MTRPTDEPLRDSIVPAKQEAKRHYGGHPYFTKRAWNVVQAYIKHFSSPGDTVLDPFGGSGVTAVESLVLRRKAIYADISEWACFLARQTAIAPVNLGRVRDSFAQIEARCRSFLEKLWTIPNAELEKTPIQDWYPKKVALPSNSDVRWVEDLFTPRMLHGLARLRGCIREIEDAESRDLLRLAFSATLARINRTFLSTEGRRESRGGSAIFSIYRYKVAQRPVELQLWEQFAKRVDRLIEAKWETNHLIGDFYRDDETAIFRHCSATRLEEWIKPGSVDYVYTDPPYGGHIAYLDLSTMWTAWLGFTISADDRADEIIEGGELRKSAEDYNQLMRSALAQISNSLKTGGWASIVFAHRDTTYWEILTEAARSAGLEYVNTAVQPVGVVWSMHKKKNPLRVLSGELVLNFRKLASVPRRRSRPNLRRDAGDYVRECCEKAIVSAVGASTEDLHHIVIPKLLEKGLLAEFTQSCPDLPPFLERFFEFDRSSRRWQLRAGETLIGRIPQKEVARYHLLCFLRESQHDRKPLTESEVLQHFDLLREHGVNVGKKTLRGLLRDSSIPIDRQPQGTKASRQALLSFSE